MNMTIIQIIQLDTYLRGIEDPPQPARLPNEDGYYRFEVEGGGALVLHPTKEEVRYENGDGVAVPSRKDAVLIEVFDRLYARAKADGEQRTKDALKKIHEKTMAAVKAAGA